jgi:hypothetical protein
VTFLLTQVNPRPLLLQLAVYPCAVVSVCCQQCGNAGRALVCTGVEKNQQDCDRIVCWCSQLLTCQRDQVESPYATLPKSGMQWLWLLNTIVCAVRTSRGYDEVFDPTCYSTPHPGANATTHTQLCNLDHGNRGKSTCQKHTTRQTRTKPFQPRESPR